MGHDPWLESLRAAGADSDALARLLAGGLPDDALQQIGHAVLGVGEVPGTELPDAVDRLVLELRERQWDGDDELADALEHLTGRQTSKLRPLPVELDDVGEVLSEHAGSESYLDLHTGNVLSHTMVDFGLADEESLDLSDTTRWLLVIGEGSEEAYRDLQRFTGTVDDDDLAAQLAEAIEGPGAFRRFRSVLERHPAEFTRWHRFDADARLGHARSWLAGEGYEARPAGSGTLA